MTTVAVVRFLGSNCDRDCLRGVESVGGEAVYAWHSDSALPAGTRAIIVPGGFSYGDYLRTGAIAAHAPIMDAVAAFADAGGPVLGICNGFQVLCEKRLLPGALAENAGGRFVCKDVTLAREEATTSPLLASVPATLTLPVAHGAGRYVDDAEANAPSTGQVAFRYTDTDADGRSTLNGSERSIAGMVGGPANNILGLMPHPERHVDAMLGGTDGRALLTALLTAGTQ